VSLVSLNTDLGRAKANRTHSKWYLPKT